MRLDGAKKCSLGIVLVVGALAVGMGHCCSFLVFDNAQGKD